MKIFIRACATLSNKPPAVNWNKYTMLKNCYDSLRKAAGIDPEIYLISDRLPEQWINQIFDDVKQVIEVPQSGNEQSFRCQVDTAAKFDGPILLLEDDYYWRPDTIKHLENAVKVLPFVSPYDHPGHYLEERFDKTYETTLIEGMVYRKAPSNTLTFATTGEILRRHIETIHAHGISDHNMFQALNATGDHLWNPTHSFATHLVGGLLAPNVDWPELW